MAGNKTTQNDASVEQFLDTIADPQKRIDCDRILDLMKEATGAEPKMWGSSIIGLGNRTYKYESGRQGDWFQIGFSPRKQNLTLYIAYGFDHYPDLMAQLGKYTTGKGCLYIKKLADIDPAILQEILARDVAAIRAAE